MRWGSKFGILITILAISCLSANLAQAVINRCCINPIVGKPSTPLGGACNWDDNECKNNGNCIGSYWEVGAPGFCDEEEDLNCATAGAQTVVTLRKGTFGCSGNAQTCGCKWTANNPEETQNIQIATCAGDGCP